MRKLEKKTLFFFARKTQQEADEEPQTGSEDEEDSDGEEHFGWFLVSIPVRYSPLINSIVHIANEGLNKLCAHCTPGRKEHNNVCLIWSRRKELF